MSYTTTAFSLSLLLPELQLLIVDSLRTEKEVLKNWSCTSKYFCSFLAPYLFESITLRNTEESGVFVDRLITKYGQCIKEMHFEGLVPGDEKGDEAFRDTVNIFPEIVESILSNLSQIPNLETVRVGFPIDFEEAGFSDHFFIEENEIAEDAAEAEVNEGWRALMEKSFNALVQNTSPGFKNLVIQNLIPKEVSTFNTAALQNLLRQMHRFELSMYGADNGAGWKLSGMPGFQSFVEKLDMWFFNDLTLVTDLSINAHEDGRIGGGYAHLPLDRTQLPLIKALRLKNIVFCPKLQIFLVNHADTLEVLELTNCHAYDEYYRVFWEDIFTSLIEAKPKKLRSLKILPRSLPLNDNDFPGDRMYMKNPDSDEVAEVRRILRENPRRRLFAYASISDKYHTLYDDEEENLARFLKGDDQRAYTELMRIIDTNTSIH
jgi:hypothetical protein